MSKAASPLKKKSTSATPAAAAAKSSTVYPPEIEEEAKNLVKSGVWKQMKDDKTGKDYFYNRTTKKTAWDLRKELMKEKEAAAGPAPVALPSFNAPTSASETDGGGSKNDTDTAAAASPTAKKPSTKKSKAASTASKASAKSTDSQDEAKQEEEANRVAAQESRENEIRENAAKETAAAVAAAVAEIKAASDLERKSLENKEMKIKEQEMNLEHHRNQKLRDLLKYTDPLDRLVQENSMLQQMVVSGSSGHVALDFQAKYEAVMRTNNALTVQMARMKQEYDAMQRALTDANFKIHQQQAQLQERAQPSGRSRDDELQMTMSFLREQNRELQQQTGELALLLARGLNEVAFRGAQNADADRGDGTDREDFLSTALSRVLDSPARQVLCSSCTQALTKFRDQSIPLNQSAIHADRSGMGSSSYRGGAVDSGRIGHSAPSYVGTGDFPATSTTSAGIGGGLNSSSYSPGLSSRGGLGGGGAPTPTQFKSTGAASNNSGFIGQQQRGGANNSASGGVNYVAAQTPNASSSGASPVMYGGFLVRNTKGSY